MLGRTLALALAALILPGCGSLIIVSELVGKWNIAVHRVILPGAEPAEAEDAGFLDFDDAVYHSWIWRYDLAEGDFYAQLDPPILEGYAGSTDLDDPQPITLKYEGGDVAFLPEQDEEGAVTLVASDVTWGGVAGIAIELEIARP